jgi:hypothetical protein
MVSDQRQESTHPIVDGILAGLGAGSVFIVADIIDFLGHVMKTRWVKLKSLRRSSLTRSGVPSVEGCVY